MHCWHQKVRLERPAADDRYGDVQVDTNKSFAVYREWLSMTRPAPGPGNLRRPLWFQRPFRPNRSPTSSPECSHSAGNPSVPGNRWEGAQSRAACMASAFLRSRPAGRRSAAAHVLPATIREVSGGAAMRPAQGGEPRPGRFSGSASPSATAHGGCLLTRGPAPAADKRPGASGFGLRQTGRAASTSSSP